MSETDDLSYDSYLAGGAETRFNNAGQSILPLNTSYEERFSPVETRIPGREREERVGTVRNIRN